MFTRVSTTIPPFSDIQLQSGRFEAKPVVCIKVDVRDPKRRVDDDCGLSFDPIWMAVDVRYKSIIVDPFSIYHVK